MHISLQLQVVRSDVSMLDRPYDLSSCYTVLVGSIVRADGQSELVSTSVAVQYRTGNRSQEIGNRPTHM
jgi:hypothetical protein